MSSTSMDRDIVGLFNRGALTSEIADRLGLNIVDVIGRLRALDVQAPSMAVRRQQEIECEAASVPLMSHPVPPITKPDIVRPKLAPPPSPRPGPSAGGSSTKSAKIIQQPTLDETLDDEAEDEDAKPRRAGVPKGWLVTEDELNRAFAGARFENLVFRAQPTRRR